MGFLAHYAIAHWWKAVAQGEGNWNNVRDPDARAT
jgi:hypothetical protein